MRTMAEEKNIKVPKPGRIEAFRELPVDILASLSKKEVRAFLFDEEWPQSLAEKLKDYVVEE
jgi:hypothetical protein